MRELNIEQQPELIEKIIRDLLLAINITEEKSVKKDILLINFASI